MVPNFDAKPLEVLWKIIFGRNKSKASILYRERGPISAGLQCSRFPGTTDWGTRGHKPVRAQRLEGLSSYYRLSTKSAIVV